MTRQSWIAILYTNSSDLIQREKDLCNVSIRLESFSTGRVPDVQIRGFSLSRTFPGHECSADEVIFVKTF